MINSVPKILKLNRKSDLGPRNVIVKKVVTALVSFLLHVYINYF